VASVLALVLLSILTVCPLMACGPTLDSSCCHPSPASCPKTTLQECPYSLLEKGKTATAMAHVLSVALQPVSSDAGVSAAYSFIQSKNRVPSSNGLYLRIRVLLI
jgi:hypothetical protein